MDLIFDIMSSGNYLNNKAEIDKNHSVVCAGRDELHNLIDDEGRIFLCPHLVVRLN